MAHEGAAADIAAWLNTLYATDPRTVFKMFDTYTRVSECTADEPHVVCVDDGHGGSQVGPLGLINGALSVLGQPRIAFGWTTVEDGRFFVRDAPLVASPQ